MNEKNTIICLDTKSKRVRENIKEYKDNIVICDDKKIYLKNMVFGKLYYFLSKNFVSHVLFYKTNSIDKIDKSEVKIELRRDKIYNVSFNSKYDYIKTKELLKKYKVIDIEYIVLFLLLIGGIIVYFLRK
jgi:hypothetical protein